MLVFSDVSFISFFVQSFGSVMVNLYDSSFTSYPLEVWDNGKLTASKNKNIAIKKFFKTVKINYSKKVV